MKVINADLLRSQRTYLIERNGDFEEVIKLIKDHVDLGFMATDEVIKDHVGNLKNKPVDYPYVMALELDDERNYIGCYFIVTQDFKDTGGLFEFSLRQTRSGYVDPQPRIFEYQIPAKDIFDAMFRLGQTYHGDENEAGDVKYEIEVLSWRLVKFSPVFPN